MKSVGSSEEERESIGDGGTLGQPLLVVLLREEGNEKKKKKKTLKSQERRERGRGSKERF